MTHFLSSSNTSVETVLVSVGSKPESSSLQTKSKYSKILQDIPNIHPFMIDIFSVRHDQILIDCELESLKRVLAPVAQFTLQLLDC